MVHQWMIFTLIFMMSGLGFAQDERYYRQILSGELPILNQANETPIPQFTVVGPAYHIDLNSDGFEEILQPQKKDGVDSLEIRNQSQRVLLSVNFFAMGAPSSIYKMRLVTISKTVKALIVFLDEGSTKGRKFESTGRFFVLTYENNDLSKISVATGPHFFHEKESQRDQYWRRDYSVNVYDFDNDGTKEIAVQYNHIQRIMRYVGQGEWTRI